MQTSTLELIKRYKEGENELLDKIVKINENLAYSLVNRYKINKKEDREDLNQVAIIGLIKAINNFDLSYGVNFSTYAVPIVLGEIKKHFRESSLLKVSRNLKDIYYQIEKEKETYRLEKGCEISLEELEKKLKLNRYDLILAMESNISPLSIEKEYSNEKDSYSLMDTLSNDKQDNTINLLTLNEAISTLNQKEKLIINLRFYHDYSQKEVAEKFKVSQVQISRMEKSIIDKLKKSF